jgi:hypothetical protein
MYGNLVDYGFILQKDRGFYVRWWGFSGSNLFSNAKCGGVGSWFMNWWRHWLAVD